MKRLLYILVAALGILACEDVIEVETPSEPPRLNVDALIRVQDSSTITNIQVKVKLTSSFFEPTTVADLEQITITNLDATTANNTVVLIEQNPGSGVYERTVDNGILREGRLFLQINYKDDIYVAQTEFVPTVPITKLIQGTETLFGGDETEVIVSFNDNADRDDFYIFDFDFNEYLVTEDEFYQGQEFEFSYFYDSDINMGQEINISILGADEGFYNYMNQVTVQSGGDQGPFQTPAATVRGNIVKESSTATMGQPENFVLGYFAVVQEFSKSIILEETN